MHFRYASEEDELPNSAQIFQDMDTEIILAEEDGEILGSAIYSENNDFGTLEYVKVDHTKKGRGIGSALVDKVLEETDKDAFYAYATSMNGKVQSILQNRGFEASGLEPDNKISDLHPNASGGFNLNLWKIDDEIQAYIPEELREFTDASLKDQREIDYLEPETDETTGSFDIVRSNLTGKWPENSSKKTNRLGIEIGEGSTLKKHIRGALDAVETDNYWAKTVSLDTTQPVTYDIARDLHQKGFKPIDLSPSIKGQELTMLDLDVEAGIYSVTEETLELIDSTGLNYVIEGSDDQTTQIIFQPSDQRESQH